MKVCGKSRDPLVLDIARDLEKSGLSADLDRIEATLAKFRAAEKDGTLDALLDDELKKADQILQKIQETTQLLEMVAAQPEDWRDPAATQRKKAAAIRREVNTRADELKQSGVRDPVAQALKEAAERYGHASGPSLGRWMRRNRC